MLNEDTNKTFIAYFDESEGVSDRGNTYTVVAAVLIRQDLSDQIETELTRIWKKYLPGIDRTEFHATDLEEASKWPFSTLANDESMKMQEELINVIGSLDLPVVAVTIDNNAIKSNPILGGSLKALGARTLAASLSVGISTGSLIDVSRGERLKLKADEGLIRSKGKRTMEEAIRLLRSFGAKTFSDLAKSKGAVPSIAMDKFEVNADIPEVASHKSAGVQLADHVARYIFKYAKNPGQPDPRYLAMALAGLTNYSQSRVTGILNSFPGVTIHIRLRKGTLLAHVNEAEEKARLEKLQILASQYKRDLQEIFNRQYVCSKCGARLFWGSPTEEIQEAADKGELLIVSSSIKKKNYCPKCKTLIFTYWSSEESYHT